MSQSDGISFMSKLRSRWAEGKLLCVGLDTDVKKIPKSFRDRYADDEEAVFGYNKAIVLATNMYVCAYKPNIAFYSRYSNALLRTIALIRKMFPGLPILGDLKRGDIGNTNEGYAIEAFEQLDLDAVTVNPSLGHDPALSEPCYRAFLKDARLGAILLCRTSNKDAAYHQDRLTLASEKDLAWLKQLSIQPQELGWRTIDMNTILAPCYQTWAIDIAQNWNQNGNCGLVVGATAPEQLAIVRRLVGDMPILVPGIGAQGGDLEKTLKAGLTKDGGLIINLSRSVLYASKREDGEDFADAAQQEAERMHGLIQQFRNN